MSTKDQLEKLIESFSPSQLRSFFEHKSNDFKPIPTNLDHYADENFQDFQSPGYLNLPEGKVLLLSAKTNHTLNERSGKKLQYENAKRILKELGSESEKAYEAGIFTYYDPQGNFRFSLIYPEYQGTKRSWNNFRRFSYYVSPELYNKTFIQRIGSDEKFLNIAQIKEAFSVDKVTKAFFDECQKVFQKTKLEFEKTTKNTVCLWLKTRYDENEYQEQINKFSYLFIGRIIFIYFLMRKGWIEDKKNYIRLITEDKSKINLYNNFFEPLFFDVFALKESERPQHIKDQYKNTPYLNGGLFEKSALELEMEFNKTYILFSDGFIRDLILNFFENYNFTVDENSPDDQEVSIDPEMLGKVFENTLAEEERGKKGTFYTPREIVHFMVKEALFQFLLNETSYDSQYLHEIIYEENSTLSHFTKEQIRLLDQKLETVKVLDPAIGSAAFPVEMMQILVSIRKKLNVKVGNNVNEVSLKKQFIKNNLYGVDIDPGAIEIAKLRMWLALIVEYEKTEIEPLPNLDFQFRVGNSLQEKIGEIDIFNENDQRYNTIFKEISDIEKIKNEMIKIKDSFYESDDEQVKRKLKKQFDDLEHSLIQKVLDKYHEDMLGWSINDKKKKAVAISSKIEKLQQMIKDGTYKLFKPDFHFSEVYDRKDALGNKVNGFDIVIGNPPYGVKVEEDIVGYHGLCSKDSYGVFISTALKRLLKPSGVLSYIISDTWLTIKTHRELRAQVLSKQLHEIIRIHQDCFDATVNACIMLLSNKETKDNLLIAADLTNLSTRSNIPHFRSRLYHLPSHVGTSTPEFAVYTYPQQLIHSNSSLPIFVASPKLFAFMNDGNDPGNFPRTETNSMEGKDVKVRLIEFNGKTIKIVKLGDIAEVKVGLQTGDNKAYLFQKPEARGTYRSIEDFKEFLLTEEDLDRIRNNENLRLEVIEKGISKDDKNSNRYFGGRYIIPYDKGGESDADEGWMPNYYVETLYYIDWSEMYVEALLHEKLVTMTSTKPYPRNIKYYFIKGITFSDSGQYSPTYRSNYNSVFDQKGSTIFPTVNNILLIGVLPSKLIKFFIRSFVNHSISSHADCQKEMPIHWIQKNEISTLCWNIVDKQKKQKHYDYASHEQIDIDRLVYEAYGLNADDIQEVENWYARRYPKLSAAQKSNLRKLGKSDDYLVLYGLRK